MKKKTGGGFSKTTLLCLQETVLRQLVRIAGLQEMTIWRSRKQDWHLSVTVTQRSQVIYLSTRRGTADPCHPSGHARAPVSDVLAFRTHNVIG